jgi:hypothetical protein
MDQQEQYQCVKGCGGESVDNSQKNIDYANQVKYI